ncbi:MAG TPA: C69 family dipeptidase [bacterium]|nr:C69 family dipeptidase [bacterium]
MRRQLFRLSVLLATFCLSGLSAQSAPPSEGGCFSIVVGKDVSTTGFVTMAHNEDDGNPQVVNHHYVPRQTHPPGAMVKLDSALPLEQVPETWAYLWSEIPGLLYSDSYVNEWGVCVCSDACRSREDQPSLDGDGINWWLRRLVAERARSAREGVRLAGQLIERFGYSGSGRTYVICDPQEGWLLAAVQGRHWVAQRVPDDQVALIANTYTIQTIDLTDSLNFLGSADVVSYATERGWYNAASDGPFDFARAYALPEAAGHPSNIGRRWDGVRRIAAQPPAYGDAIPFAVTPARKVDAPMLMAILRSHFEGTPLYAADSLTGCPHSNPTGPICGDDTQTSFVAELRGDMPKEIGLTYWACFSSPCLSCYIPFHFDPEVFPAHYTDAGLAPTIEEYTARTGSKFSIDSASAYWTFTSWRHHMSQRYGAVSASVRDAFGAIEADAGVRHATAVQEALRQWPHDPEGARRRLREFSARVYRDAIGAMVYLTAQP